MKEDLIRTGEQHVRDVRRINRELIEKALRMRCLGHVAQARARLLTETIFEIDQGKKTLQKINREVVEQRELIAVQKAELERVNEQLREVRQELERRVERRTADLVDSNRELAREIEERRHAEEALRAGERKYRLLYETMAEGVVYQDAGGRIESANPAAERILGLSLEQLQGRTSLDPRWRTVYEDGRPFPGNDLPAMVALRTGKPVGNVVVGVFHPGRETTVWLLVSSVPQFRPGERKPWQVYSTFADITDCKMAERALGQSKAEFEAMFNAISDAVIFADTERRIVMANRAVIGIFGYGMGELVGNTTEMLYAHRADYLELGRTHYRMDAPQHDGPYELLYRRKDGTTFVGETLGRMVRDTQGNTLGFIGVIRDISERKAADEALRQSEERYRLLFDKANDGIYVVDPESRTIVDCNRKAAEINGYSVEELRGMAVADLHPEHELALLPEKFREVAELGHSVDAITGMHHRRKDGTLVPIEVSAAMVDVGRRRLNISVVRDVTERIKVEEERGRLQRQLQQAQKMESIGHLTGGIAHDFNNILAIIMGFTSLALAQFAAEGEGKLAEYLNRIYVAGERARDLVSQMLTFSRGAAGEPQALALPALVTEVVRMLGSTLPSSIELDVDLDEAAPPIMMDPIQLDQIVMNLCINARDAMAGVGRLGITLRGPCHIESECASCHELVGGGFVELAVRDSGTGIDPAVQRRIFEPFFSTKEVGSGSGMGLSVVHGIMHKHGGHILIETSAASGTVFRLLFPPAAGVAEPAPGGGNDLVWPPAVEHGKHVLVADDEESVAGFLKELLETRGYRVTVATDGGQALAVLREQSRAIDLLLTDQTMPVMTGAELTQAALAIQPDLPIILCTGYSDSIEAQRAEQIGVAGFLAKPVEERRLLGLLYELLHHQGRSPRQ